MVVCKQSGRCSAELSTLVWPWTITCHWRSLIRADDLPNFEIIACNRPNRLTPAGIKGMSEGGVMGAPLGNDEPALGKRDGGG